MSRAMPAVDWVESANAATLDAFVRTSPSHFLAGRTQLTRPASPMKTISSNLNALRGGHDTWMDNDTARGQAPSSPAVPGRWTLIPVRKMQNVFPDMITVGRATNNDVIVSDVSVSKFHAFFQQAGDEYAIVDAGSTNGTKVNGRVLEAKADPTRLVIGDRLRLGGVELWFVDAKSAWEAIHARRTLK